MSVAAVACFHKYLTHFGSYDTNREGNMGNDSSVSVDLLTLVVAKWAAGRCVEESNNQIKNLLV